MRTEPSERPKAEDALKQLEEIVSQRSKPSLHWRLIEHETGRLSRFLINACCSTREGVLAARQMIGKHNSCGLICFG